MKLFEGGPQTGSIDPLINFLLDVTYYSFFLRFGSTCPVLEYNKSRSLIRAFVSSDKYFFEEGYLI